MTNQNSFPHFLGRHIIFFRQKIQFRKLSKIFNNKMSLSKYKVLKYLTCLLFHTFRKFNQQRN